MRFCGLEAHQIPTFDNPIPDLSSSENGSTSLPDGTLGHACQGKLIKGCSQMWVFKEEDLEKQHMTQIEALELKCCQICTPAMVPTVDQKVKAHG